MTIVITAYNEEKRIEQKIQNTIELIYPKGQLEIIIVSDGSTDRTEEVVKSFVSNNVILLPMPVRKGKHHGQGEAIKSAKGEIIVFTDATTFLQKDAIVRIIENFSDPEIGCVSGLDKPEVKENQPSGEGVYVRYEMSLRALESKVGSLIGASGSFFAIRKKLCREWYGDLSSDFYLPIICAKNRYRTIIEPDAIGFYTVLNDSSKEFQRKVRTVVHGIDTLFHFIEVLNPLKYGFFSIQMLSHKLSRWLAPFCMVVILLINPFLFSYGNFYFVFFLGQIVFYLLALAGALRHNLQEKTSIKVPFFFAMVNISILIAWSDLARGKRHITWESTKR